MTCTRESVKLWYLSSARLASHSRRSSGILIVVGVLDIFVVLIAFVIRLKYIRLHGKARCPHHKGALMIDFGKFKEPRPRIDFSKFQMPKKEVQASPSTSGSGYDRTRKPLPENAKEYIKENYRYNKDTGIIEIMSWKLAMVIVEDYPDEGCYDSYPEYVQDGYVPMKTVNNPNAYERTPSICGKSYMAHRVAYFLATGEDPYGKVIDHINGDKSDNRFSNLRLVSHKDNVQNIKKYSRNSASGILGAHLMPNGRYRAEICVNGKQMRLGSFSTAEEAHARYLEAKDMYHPGFVLQPPLPTQPR